MSSSIVTDFGLICDYEFMVALVGSIYMAGLFFGSYLFGMLSDKLGRKKTAMTAIIIGALFQTIGAWMPGYYSYTVTRFGSAIGKSNYPMSSDIGTNHFILILLLKSVFAGSMGIFMVPFTLVIETIGQKWATPIGILFQTPFAIGEIILGLLVMGVRDWNNLHMATGIPMFALVLMYFVLPESPRWLIAKKRFAEARATIEKAAKINGVTLRGFFSEILQTIILWRFLILFIRIGRSLFRMSFSKFPTM